MPILVKIVKGFWCGEGSNFGLFYWLASSPLEHSRTTVWVCEPISGTGARYVQEGAFVFNTALHETALGRTSYSKSLRVIRQYLRNSQTNSVVFETLHWRVTCTKTAKLSKCGQISFSAKWDHIARGDKPTPNWHRSAYRITGYLRSPLILAAQIEIGGRVLHGCS